MFGAAKIRLRPLAQLCSRLATATAAGLDDRRIWAAEAERGSRAQRAAAQQISNAVSRGEAVSDALKTTGQFFPPLFGQMVAVGEVSGKLERTYRQLAGHYERLLSAKRAFWGRMTWPLFQLFSAPAVVGLLIWIMGILPINNRPGAEGGFDLLGLGLAGNRGLAIYLSVVGAAGAIGFAAFESARRGARWGQWLYERILDLPLIGPALRTIALARFTWAMELVFDTAMDLRRALPLALDATGQSTFSRHGPRVAQDIAAGKTIHQALAATGEFPVELLDSIAVGEESGSLVETMKRQSAEYRERASAAMGLMAQILGYVLWAAIAALIIFIIIRIFSTYVGAIEGLANGQL